MNGRTITRQLFSLVAATIVMQGCSLAPGMKAQNPEEAKIEHANVERNPAPATTCAPRRKASKLSSPRVEADLPAGICYEYRLMTLESGSQLANYEILEPIGAGGMDSPRRVKRKRHQRREMMPCT